MIDYNENADIVNLLFMSSGEEVVLELSLSELKKLKDQIDRYLDDHNVSDKKLYQQMQELIKKTDEEVARWHKTRDVVSNEDYSDYQSYCYGKIWDKFWKLHRQISVQIDYCDPDTTYYEDIMAAFRAYQEIEW